MADFLRLILPIYFVVYFGIAIVLKSVVVAKRTGKNPLVLPKEHGEKYLSYKRKVRRLV